MERKQHGIFLPQYQWDDIQGSALTSLKGGGAPTIRTYNFGIGGGIAFLVYGYAVGEYTDIWVQTSHSMKLKSMLENHLHWCVPAESVGTKFQIQIDLIHAAIGEPFAVPSESPLTAEYTMVGGEATKHNYLDIGPIDGHNETVSTLYCARVQRIAATSNEYAGEVYFLYNDFHYLKDSVGSRFENTK